MCILWLFAHKVLAFYLNKMNSYSFEEFIVENQVFKSVRSSHLKRSLTIERISSQLSSRNSDKDLMEDIKSLFCHLSCDNESVLLLVEILYTTLNRLNKDFDEKQGALHCLNFASSSKCMEKREKMLRIIQT